MNTEEQVNEWLEISQEDLEVAQLCYSGRKFLHCAYMCQQAVEKALKGLIAAQGEIPLPIHNLPQLAMEADVWECLSMEQRIFLRALTTYAIEARYPERKRKLHEICTQSEAGRVLHDAGEMISWIGELINERLSQEK